jgi:hypothetical protein
MKEKIVLFVMLMYGGALCDGTRHALEVDIGMTDGHEMYVPVPSFSFDWIKEKGCHELSAEFFIGPKKIYAYDEEWQTIGFGLLYSYLFRMPLENMYLGPAAGMIDVLNKFGNRAYFCGIKAAYIIGRNSFRLKIQDRLLAGKEGAVMTMEDAKIALLNTLSIGIIWVF